ncbi:hypothetical protein PUN28_006452 [Cardiocondyla obscurior]|uniref:Uncharacterized protein n=1 Tax=Cardiocondyla obscurior TaxID=286306 RepID=A0AAW2G8P1_9HYME
MDRLTPYSTKISYSHSLSLFLSLINSSLRISRFSQDVGKCQRYVHGRDTLFYLQLQNIYCSSYARDVGFVTQL